MNDNFIQNGFIKIKSSKKILILLCNKTNNIKQKYIYDFETNIINNIENTDIKFSVCCSEIDSGFIHFFTNKLGELDNYCDYDASTRTFFRGITDVLPYRYIFNYKEHSKLTINIDQNYYLEVYIDES